MHSEARGLGPAPCAAALNIALKLYSQFPNRLQFSFTAHTAERGVRVGNMSLLLLLAASEGHVRLNYIDGSDLPIRNAGTATGNGRASVDGSLAR